MDRCALFVDAGYLLADGAMAVHGTRNRDSVSWDYAGLVRLLSEVARDRTGLSLLRCYWYETTVDERHNQEQDSIADVPGLKFRAARIRPGRREGVESYVQRDLTTLARSGQLCEAVVVSGDEDMAEVVAEGQDLGIRVSVLHVGVEGNWTISRALRRECDDLIEVGAGHLRPYVNLLTPSESAEAGGHATPLANGQAHGTPISRQPVNASVAAERVEPADTDVMYANTGGQPAGSAMEQLRAMQQSIAHGRGGGQPAPSGGNQHPAPGPQSAPSGGYPAQYAHPNQAAAHPNQTGGHPTQTGGHAMPSGGYPAQYAHPNQAAAHPNQTGGHPTQTGGHPNQTGGHAMPSGGYPAQYAHPNQTGGHPTQTGGHPTQTGGHPNQTGGHAMPSGGYPAQYAHPNQAAAHPNQTGGHPTQTGGHPTQTGGHPNQTGGHAMPSGGYPAQYGHPHQPQSQANPNMRGVNGSGPHNHMQPQNSGGHSPPTGGNAPYNQGEPPGQDPRYDSRTGQNPGYGGGPPVNPTSGASTGTEPSLRGATVTQNGTRPATGPHPTPQVQHGPYTDPTPQVGHTPSGPQEGSQAVAEAVRAAYKEGGDFGASIARDAPALWVEAVLAGQPRMPADLEARLLQGSVLSVDYLLRDDVRESLRSGFWAALERCRA